MESLNTLRRARRPARRDFETLCKEMEVLLKEKPLNEVNVKAKYQLFSESFSTLMTHDSKIVTALASDEIEETEENKEFDEMREIKMKAETIRQLKEKLLPVQIINQPNSDTLSAVGSIMEPKVRNFKLPTVQIKKFSGELEDWLGFWAQFEKIDEDAGMCGSDKFWYLMQSLTPKTDAYEIAAGYPQSNENYGKVVEALKRRFADEDLQLQVYLRKLLNLVISNVKSKEKIPLKKLFTSLDSNLRALKTLKLENADPATWLFPLVESSLPEDILYNWQRSPLSSKDGSKEDPPVTRLDYLMSFIQKEVEITQRIEITRSFAVDQGAEKKEVKVVSRDRRQLLRSSVPTLTSFHVGEAKKSCVFCDRGNHNSKDCFRARNMEYEQKMTILKEKKLCFICCGSHMARDCPQRKKLECLICRRSHLTVLCKDMKRRNSSGDAPPQKKSGRGDDGEIRTTTNNSNFVCSGEVALQTVRVGVASGGKEEVVRAFFDPGSQRSYILQSLARRLGLKSTGMERVVHSLFGDKRTEVVTHHKYQIKLKAVDNEAERMLEVRDQKKLCGGMPVFGQNNSNLLKELRMKKVELSDSSTGPMEIQIVIGSDYARSLETGKTVKLSSGAVAVETIFGWALTGVMPKNNLEGNIANLYLTMYHADASLTQLWELEAIGIRDCPEEGTVAKEEERSMEVFKKNVRRDMEGRYFVKLPWREEIPYLPSNREVAFKRLQSATKKLLEKKLYGAYDKIFMEREAQGFIEKVKPGDGAVKIHYLPHRPVVKDSPTTPVRPVFDASCRVGKSPSLNDCLLKGENYILKILDILLGFRVDRIAFTADVKKAFQMIGVEAEDQDVMRFLWWENEKTETVVEYKHVRVMFGATCSPFILGAVLFIHLNNLPDEDAEIGRKLLSTLYVDNCVSSEKSVKDYHRFREKAVALLKEAGMELRMWMSNFEDLDDNDTRVISILGLQWDRKEDELFINMKGVSMPEKVTKRTVLSTVQKIFDPIGFTCPAILPMKLLLQRTWMSKAKWDVELPEAESLLFKKWCGELSSLGEIRIPRLCTSGVSDRSKWSLVTFTDGSREAYAALVFLRVEEEECVSIHLLGAKSRVAPVKVTMTIPKIELMGCLIGARLATAVKKALKMEGVREIYFCDSTTALAWIRRNDQWGTFVANRSKEIVKLTEVEKWRHVPGAVNPADLPSRGCSPSKLLESRFWEGPAWLLENEENWPTSSEAVNEEEVFAERKKTAVVTSVVSFSIMDKLSHSHSWLGMVRILAWVRRFLFNKFVKNPERRRTGGLTSDEIRKAEILFVRDIQREAFPVEKREKLTGLELIEDDWGVLRVKTRLTYRDLPNNFKFPMLLPAKREEVKQLIQDHHCMKAHAGAGYLAAKLRSNYWIIKSRQTIKQVISKCQRCRRYSAKATVPEPAPLPLDRVKDAEIFEVVGVDLAGPLMLKNGSKVWIVVFTCAIYRAVHLDMVKNISTQAFIGALGRFIEKYRRPDIVYSDNGTNFRGAVNLFKKLNWTAIQEDEKCSQIKWKFNPVTAAWWGGWFERLIRTMKDLLRRTIGKGSLNWSEMKSTLATVVEIMNSRPLTYISESTDDLEPLTPSLFLNPQGLKQFPEGEITEAERLRIRIKYMRKLKEELKNRFLKEYLAFLVNRHPKKATRPLVVGELVLVGSDNLKRLEWPLGRIMELIPGKDAEVRLARVKVEKGEIVRAVQRLYPLEMDAEEKYTKPILERSVRRSGRRVTRPSRFGQ